MLLKNVNVAAGLSFTLASLSLTLSMNNNKVTTAVHAGLANGAMATVENLALDPNKKNNVLTVTIRLHSDGSTHNIEKAKQDYEVADGQVKTRQQFPLAPSYAITVHKVCTCAGATGIQ
jgi:hypothetical protein